MQRMLELGPILNVAPNSKARVNDIDQGYIYDGFLLELKSTGNSLTKSDLTNIVLKIGSKAVVQGNGAELDTIQKYLGRTANAEYLAIYFADPNAPDVIGERAGALDTLNFQYPSLSLEFEIGACTDPEITLLGLIGGAKPKDTAPVFRAMRRNSQTIQTGKEFPLLPDIGEGARLARLHVFHANMTRLNVSQRSIDLVNGGDIARIQYMQNELARVAQPGHFCYDRLLRDRHSGALRLWDNTGRPIPTKFMGNFSAGDDIDMIAEVFTDWNRL